MDEPEVPPVHRPRLRSWPIRVDRVVYTTITLMAVLIIYDGWNDLTVYGVIAVIAGPLTAIFMSHVFAESLAHRVTAGRPLAHKELRSVVAKESRFLLIGVLPLFLLLVLSVFGVSYDRAIQVIISVGVLSLGFWGGLAGRRAGLRGWSFVVSILYGLILGAIILMLQAVLQPGSEPFVP